MGYTGRYGHASVKRNKGTGRFTDRAAGEGIDPRVEGLYLPERIGGKQAARSSRCAVAADFDGDGRLDLMVNNFNDRPYYFRNRFPVRNYVALRLTGTVSNRDAVGAVAWVYPVGGGPVVRQVHAAGGDLSHG